MKFSKRVREALIALGLSEEDIEALAEKQIGTAEKQIGTPRGPFWYPRRDDRAMRTKQVDPFAAMAATPRAAGDPVPCTRATGRVLGLQDECAAIQRAIVRAITAAVARRGRFIAALAGTLLDEETS